MVSQSYPSWVELTGLLRRLRDLTAQSEQKKRKRSNSDSIRGYKKRRAPGSNAQRAPSDRTSQNVPPPSNQPHRRSRQHKSVHRERPSGDQSAQTKPRVQTDEPEPNARKRDMSQPQSTPNTGEQGHEEMEQHRPTKRTRVASARSAMAFHPIDGSSQ